MTDISDIRIAPRLDRITHKPIRAEVEGKDKWGYWRVKDYPGYGIHGKDSADWDNDDWNMAINIFEDRIHGRFLNIVSGTEIGLFAGFAVMALDCLLCETLQQFYDGVDQSKSPTNDFVRFLTTSSFNQYFGTDRTRNTSKAAVFYDQIRCGILHQAEVKRTSLIEIEEKYSLVDWSDDQNTGLIINRKKFHRQLIKEFNDYLTRLRSHPIISAAQPWDNFKKKMDYIARV